VKVRKFLNGHKGIQLCIDFSDYIQNDAFGKKMEISLKENVVILEKQCIL
jgi:hypothetical protein